MASFLEIQAVHRLSDSLRLLFLYSAAELKLKSPILRVVLDQYGDEAFALLMLLIDGHSLKTNDASFAETFYGLRRRRLDKPSYSRDKRGLTKSQRGLSLLFLVGLPYMKSKTASVYEAHRESIRPTSLYTSAESSQAEAQRGEQCATSGHITRKVTNAGIWLYPWIDTITRGVSCTYQFLYLLKATTFFTPGLHFMKLYLSHACSQEMFIQRQSFQFVYKALDYLRASLLFAIFFKNMCEWWHGGMRKRLLAHTYPPPFPPPPPKEGGIQAPADKTLCPLCSKLRMEPKLCAACGLLFCGACIYKYVEQNGRCPMTYMPMNVKQIRTLKLTTEK